MTYIALSLETDDDLLLSAAFGVPGDYKILRFVRTLWQRQNCDLMEFTIRLAEWAQDRGLMSMALIIASKPGWRRHLKPDRYLDFEDHWLDVKYFTEGHHPEHLDAMHSAVALGNYNRRPLV